MRNQARADFAEHRLEVETVDAPQLVEGDSCGSFQFALTYLSVSDGFRYAYEACFVSGTWHLEGPIFPD